MPAYKKSKMSVKTRKPITAMAKSMQKKKIKKK